MFKGFTRPARDCLPWPFLFTEILVNDVMYGEVHDMNRKETIDRAYRNMRNGKNRDLLDLFWSIEKSV